MSTCLNCGAKLSCGCQKRTTSNGKSACSNCLPNYERLLKKNTTTTVVPNLIKSPEKK